MLPVWTARSARNSPRHRFALIGLKADPGEAPPRGGGQRIQGAHPDFDPRSYGCANLSTLVERSGGLDLRKDANNVHVRRKAAGVRVPARGRPQRAE